MPVKITNVSQDPAYAMKRRTASRLQMEPVIAGERLRLRQSRILTDEQAEANKDWLAECERGGVVTIERDGEKVPTLPTAEAKAPVETTAPTDPAPFIAPPPAAGNEPTLKLPPLPEPTPPSETPSSEAGTQPPPMGHRRDDKKRGR